MTEVHATFLYSGALLAAELRFIKMVVLFVCFEVILPRQHY